MPILMYHAVGGPAVGHRPRYDRHGLNIRADTFRKQLELMYRAGWYPVNVRDLVSPRIEVPAGKIPVALTFDDARGSQFRYLKDGSIDPQCAVGILLAFHRKHPDWPLRATFYVMGRSRWNPVPFYQPRLDAKKLRWLVDHGCEIGNHSTSHRLFTHLDPATERWEIGECARYVKLRAPGATMDTFALPGGGKPRSHAGWEALMYGKACGVAYRHKAVLLAWGGPAPAPARKDFDRWRIPRIGAEPGNIEYWIRHLTPGGRIPAFVSDGVPDLVSAPRKYAGALVRNLPATVRFVAYDARPHGSTPVRRSAAGRGSRKG
ncbi:MAG: polysaccharide deacetylase family protein [Chthonomonadales bacterium]